MKKSILFASLLGIAITGYAFAQEHPKKGAANEHPEHPKKSTVQYKAVEATVVGENICVGCALGAAGAGAQCSTNGHQHALKVTTATAAGKEIPEMKGWMLHYLDTDKAQPVIKGHDGATLTLRGRIYADARVLEVQKVETVKAAKKSEHPEHPKKK